jgi:hypothetical protein
LVSEIKGGTQTEFENMVLGRILGPKRDEVTGGRRKLHNEELHNLYSSPSIIRRLERPRRRWTDNIKIDLRVIRWAVMDTIDLFHDRGSGGFL